MLPNAVLFKTPETITEVDAGIIDRCGTFRIEENITGAVGGAFPREPACHHQLSEVPGRRLAGDPGKADHIGGPDGFSPFDEPEDALLSVHVGGYQKGNLL
jgi:hypothetical protein